jgi:putative acetyltransferase
MKVTIRSERDSDHPAISEVICLAFGRQAEASLVENLRQTPNYKTELSLVAIENNQIVGHILFSEASLESPKGCESILTLAPLAVHPDYQNQGIGSYLVRYGLNACRNLGYDAVVVLGHADYYPRFGFSPTIKKGIYAPFEVPEEAFMVIELSPGCLNNMSGVVNFPPQFDGV